MIEPENSPETGAEKPEIPATPAPVVASNEKPLSVTSDGLAERIALGMPDPTPGSAPEEVQTDIPGTEQSAPPPPTGPVDASGQVFIKGYHRENADGSPKTHKSTGNFMKIIGAPDKPPAPPPVSATQAFNLNGAPDKFDTQAEMALQAVYGVAAGFLSDEIRPDNKEEHESLRMPLAAVMREKQFDRITPTQLLIVSLLAYIGKKATKPTVKEKFVMWYLRIKNFGKPKQVQPAQVENNFQAPRV